MSVFIGTWVSWNIESLEGFLAVDEMKWICGTFAHIVGLKVLKFMSQEIDHRFSLHF